MSLRGDHGCTANRLQQCICWASGVSYTNCIWLIDISISLPTIDTIRLVMHAYVEELSRWFGRGVGYGAAFAPAGERRGGLVSTADVEAGMELTRPLLESAAAVCRRGHGEEAWRRREKLITEWDEWRQSYPVAVRPSFETSHPWDVLAFLEHWRSRHCGRRASAGGQRRNGREQAHVEVAPGTLRATASHLSRVFEGVGVGTGWSVVAGQIRRQPGDACLGKAVPAERLRRPSISRERLLQQRAGAVPVDADQHCALMRHLLASAEAGGSAYERALSLRDACAFAYLWETGQRGKECCQLSPADFCYADKGCSCAWDDIRAGTLPEARRLLVECSAGTKTRQTKHPGVLEVTERLGARCARCCRATCGR